jgi:type IV pilus assembly protein PilM
VAKRIAIELGNSLIRILEIGSGKIPKVGKKCEFVIEDGIVADGAILNVERLSEIIRIGMNRCGIRGKNVIFTINSSRIASREIKLPKIAPAKMRQVVIANSTSYFPVDIDEYEVGYRIVGDVEGDVTKRTVLIYIVPKKFLQDYYTLADNLNFDIEAFDYAGNSIFQVAKGECKEGTTLVAKIEESSTMLTVIKNQVQMLQRSTSVGADSLILDVMEERGDTYLNTFEYLKLNDVLTSDFPEIENSATEELISGIVKTIDFYNNAHPNDQITKILVTGMGSSIKGLVGEINRVAGIPSQHLKPTSLLMVDRVFRDKSFGDFVDCFGAGILPLGFKPDKSKKKDNPTDMGRLSIIIFFGCLFISLALMLTSLLGFLTAKADNAEKKLYLNSLQYVVTAYNDYVGVYVDNKYVKELDAATHNRNEEITAFIKELEEKMPTDIRVSGMACTEEDVLITMEVSSKQEVAKILDTMLDFDSLAEVTITGISDESTEDGKKSVTFTMRCKYFPYELREEGKTNENQ